ncbi:hypothetical protein O6H91_16G077100 [Diphasiastrum complanatum]|uniref:Uncharacterized protein n=1 Tax=Diphasiastrum complanatum TaxID=34168 RepID=A0ACC2BDT5_DIPCM|nr:hypothetical protein O6H91_16G077100 [Diphasiastrum complanatum]
MYLTADRTRKRRRGERLYGVHTYGDPGCPADYDGPFRDNVRAFLNESAEFEPYSVEGMPIWSISLQEDKHAARISLLIIEESLEDSLHPHCEHCRCIGWSHHPVSNRRYHFIIPIPELEERPLGLVGMVGGKVCPNCNDPIPAPLYNCSACGEEAVQGSVLDLQSHLLHGVIHCNGYGHLLRINGREKGSKFVSGREIMDLWDRLCAMLRARKVSVEDIAKKRSLEFRLLHSVAYGECWYGRWGYKFGHGSFGITQQMYTKAIEAIRGMPLSVMIQHFEDVDQDVLVILAMYQRISGHALQTVGDLIRFMMELKARLPLHSTPKSFPKGAKDSDRKLGNGMSGTSDVPCRWSVKRLDLATQVIVEALKNCEKKWMPRQDVRDAARVYIGDTGLLDFVLKSLGNRVVGGHVVRRAVNPITKVLEYSLEDVNSSSANSSIKGKPEPVCEVGRAEVLRDIVYLYRHVLESYKPARRGVKSVLTAIPTATRIILDTKQFIKDYRGEVPRKCANNEWDMDDDEMLRIMCHVILKDNDPKRDRPSPPAELVVLPPHATVGDLKQEAQRAFRETYHIMRNFVVTSIPDLEGDDEDLLFGAIESGSSVIVQGTGIDVFSEWRYEGGNDSWIVDCPCGTKDDDGERMIACDVCEVWQHTRCGGISDLDAIPVRFLCHRCGTNLFQAML